MELVKFYKPSTMLEVGCWDGEHGTQMCMAALASHDSNVHYTMESISEAFNKCFVSDFIFSISRTIKDKIALKFDALTMEFPHRFTYKLIRGDTNYTMKEHVVDFAFLDGGHSVGTVQNDYAKSNMSKVIVFDDYFTEDVEGHIPEVSYLGTNVVVDAILDKAKWVFPSNDPVREGGITHLAVIVNEGAAPPNKDVLLVPLLISNG